MKTCGLSEKRDSREISGVANETFFPSRLVRLKKETGGGGVDV